MPLASKGQSAKPRASSTGSRSTRGTATPSQGRAAATKSLRPPAEPPAQGAGSTHVVQPGDTLWELAERRTSKGLLQAARSKDWATFALMYNGEGYAANAYDVKLAQAYDAWQAVVGRLGA